MSSIVQAIKKLRTAVEIDAKRHQSLWCLGNAYNAQANLALSVHFCILCLDPNGNSYSIFLNLYFHYLIPFFH